VAKRDYSSWSKEQLVAELHELNKRKKFGLVWEDKNEDNAEVLQGSIPLFKHLPKKDLLKSEGDDSNLMIVGDNLHSLSVLNYTHSKSFDVIYIDPPYNTGNSDFIYNDKYVKDDDTYRHSMWLSFMQRRLKLAKKLLASGGLIFISIDDNEYPRLALIADEIFGASRRIGPIVWFYEGVNDNTAFIKKTHEYVLCYSADDSPKLSRQVRDNNVSLGENISNSVIKNGVKNPPSAVSLPAGFPADFEDGVIKASAVKVLQVDQDIVVKDFKLVNPVTVTSGWSSRNILENFIRGGFTRVLDANQQQTTFVIKKSGNIHYEKIRDTSHVLSVVRNLGTTQQASEELKAMGLSFSFPKPVGLISYLLSFHSSPNARILDFFAGSGTTGQAALELNNQDGGNRTFVVCTSNEGKIAEEICYPRLASVIKGYGKAGNLKEGIAANLRYLEISLFRRSATDSAKRRLTQQATDVLCVKENAFDPVLDESTLKVFSNSKFKVAVLFEPDDVDKLVEVIQSDVNSKYLIYVFSLSTEDLAEELEQFGSRAKSVPVPEGLLNSYYRTLGLIGGSK
jgi:adenine-specific DNA-methyltransferase